MAMNKKKEQAAYDELVAQARINRLYAGLTMALNAICPYQRSRGIPKTAGASTPPLALFIRHGAELRFTAHGEEEVYRATSAASESMNSMNGIPV